MENIYSENPTLRFFFSFVFRDIGRVVFVGELVLIIVTGII